MLVHGVPGADSATIDDQSARPVAPTRSRVRHPASAGAQSDRPRTDLELDITDLRTPCGACIQAYSIIDIYSR